MKKIYIYLIILVVGIFLWINFFSLKNCIKESFVPATYNNIFSAPQENLDIAKDKITISDEIDLDFPFPLNKMYKIENGQNYLYTLSYKPSGNIIKKGSTLNMPKGRDQVSDQLNLIFRESYPNITLEEMGVNSIEEAYLATQLAIWEIAWRTGESKSGSEYSFIESIKNDVGINKKTEKIFKKAEDLVRFVENYSFKDSTTENLNLVTTLVVNTENVAFGYKDGRSWFGPYYYRVENGIVDSAEIVLEDIEGTATSFVEIVDDKNNPITNVKDEELKPIYISIPDGRIEDFVLKVIFKVDASKILGIRYEDNYYDYIVNSTYKFDKDSMQQSVKLTYNN